MHFIEKKSFQSRIHPLRTFPKDTYVLRDDELSFSISGSKFRKYASLFPKLIEAGIQNVVLIGGRNSNNVCGLLQLLIEHGIAPYVFTLPQRGDPKGNAYLSSMLLPEDHWKVVERERWRDVLYLANEFSRTLKNVLVLEEGAFHPWCLPGAMTLAEAAFSHGEWDHIFIEAGTGFQAAALLLGIEKIKKKGEVHVLLVAGSEESFMLSLKRVHSWDPSLPFPTNFNLAKPSVGASFGSTPSAIRSFLREIPQNEGFFVDPIYSGKLFYYAKEKCRDLSGNKLIIHSGGGIALFGNV